MSTARSFTALLLSGAAFALAAPAALTQLEVAEFLPPTPGDHFDFGLSSSIDGDWMAVGSAVAGATNHGQTVLYARNRAGTPDDPSDDSWQVYTVLQSPLDTASAFGAAVALDGDRLIVGAPRTTSAPDVYVGAAFIYRRVIGSWELEDVLWASDGEDDDGFGLAVDLSGDVAVVGAPSDDDLSASSGAVYVFHQDAVWVQQAKLHGDDPQGDSPFFGESVAVDGQRVLVGSKLENGAAGEDTGAAYVFARDDHGTLHPADDSWEPQAHLMAADADESWWFGSSVALDGDRALVGAMLDRTLGHTTGAAYVLEFDAAWSQTAKLYPSDTVLSGLFGSTVALRGPIALVGGHQTDISLADAYHHVGRGVWEAAGVLALPPPRLFEGPSPPTALGFDGDSAVLSRPGSLVFGLNEGVASVFAIEQAPWAWIAEGLGGEDGAPSLFGAGPVGGGPVSLALQGGTPNAAAVLVVGATELNAPFKGGVLVPQPDRLFALPLDANGSASLSGLGLGGLPSGFELLMQAWMPQPSAPQGFAATNALSLIAP